jgi:hypothetical protein
MTGIADIASRVQQLQALMSPPAPAPTTPSTGGGPDFAAALAAAQSPSTVDAAVPAPAASVVSGADVAADARRYLGVPYVWGGTNPATGLDCSGLVQRVYADLGVQLPRLSHDQARAGVEVPDLAAAKPGDILAFGHPVNHVAIYLGGNQMIAAPEPGDHVRVQSVYTTPTAIRRILPDPSAPAGAVPYAPLFAQAGTKYGVPPELLAAVAQVESGYDPSAVSPAGARGLMQLMPSTAAGLGVNPMDPAQAVDGAARLLSGDLASFGSLPLALAAYNAGPGAVHRYGGVPPYPETQAYVDKVQATMATFTGTGSGP